MTADPSPPSHPELGSGSRVEPALSQIGIEVRSLAPTWMLKQVQHDDGAKAQ